MCDNVSLPFLFPDVPTEVALLTNNAGAIAVQSIPTAIALLSCLLLYFMPHRRAPPRSVRRITVSVSFVSLVALGFLVWNAFDLLSCDFDVETWRYVTLVSLVLFSALLLGLGFPRFPRISSLLLLVLSSGVVVMDVMLRGWIVVSFASTRLVSIQQILSYLSVAVLVYLPGRRHAVTPVSKKRSDATLRSSLGNVDALSVKDPIRSGRTSPTCVVVSTNPFL